MSEVVVLVGVGSMLAPPGGVVVEVGGGSVVSVGVPVGICDDGPVGGVVGCGPD